MRRKPMTALKQIYPEKKTMQMYIMQIQGGSEKLDLCFSLIEVYSDSNEARIKFHAPIKLVT